MTHELKTIAPYFGDVVLGKKTFEVRKNDRNFQVGDFLHLRERDEGEHKYTGQEAFRSIVYILKGEFFGIHKDFCIMGIK